MFKYAFHNKKLRKMSNMDVEKFSFFNGIEDEVLDTLILRDDDATN